MTNIRYGGVGWGETLFGKIPVENGSMLHRASLHMVYFSSTKILRDDSNAVSALGQPSLTDL